MLINSDLAGSFNEKYAGEISAIGIGDLNSQNQLLATQKEELSDTKKSRIRDC